MAEPGKKIQAPMELVEPDYNLYRYRPDMYKVVRNRSTAPRGGRLPRKKEDGYKNTDKLPQAISRARRVCLELALCNDWKWFCTFTIAQDNYDRKNLARFYEHFTEWIKYKRKVLGASIPYLLVPEQHGDGSWHMHGFMDADIDPLLVSFASLRKAGENVPWKLVKGGYYNLPDYQKKFGFCSFGKIRNRDAAAFYATKYISKSFLGGARKVGLRLYYCSQGLNHSEYADSVYGPCPDLDRWLTNHYRFCSTGFIHFDREPGYDPVQDILEIQRDQLCPMRLEDLYPPEVVDEVDRYYDYTQMSFKV